MSLFSADDRIGEYTVDWCGTDGTYYENYYVLGSRKEKLFAKVIRLEDLKPYSFDPEGGVLEAEIAPLLSHPNLCRLSGSGSMEKEGHRLLYLVSECAWGDSLRKLIERREPMTSQELMHVMHALLSALGSLHGCSRPVIHNSVCPEAVYVSEREFSRLKLTGFGRARFSDLRPDPSSCQGQDLFCVAPERLEGGGSVRSDIFSAGAVMYELVFGIRPWQTDLGGKNREEQVRAVTLARESPLPVPECRLVNISDSQFRAMIRALSPDPEKRFASAGEFLDALWGDAGADGMVSVAYKSVPGINPLPRDGGCLSSAGENPGFLFRENDTAGRFTILRPTSRHSDYETYLAKDSKGAMADLKVIYSYLESYDNCLLGNHASEGAIIAGLSHRNVCRCTGCFEFEKDGKKYDCWATEHPDWKSLRALRAEQISFSVKELRDLTEALLSALWSIESGSVKAIHNAVFPENILIDHRDFSSLKLAGFDSAVTEYTYPDPVSAPFCSDDLYYVAPERFIGKAYVSSDVYSVGVLLYWLVFADIPREAEMPWDTDLAGKSQEERIWDVMASIRKPLSTRGTRFTDVDDQVIDVIKRAMSWDPEKRFASAREFLAALQDIPSWQAAGADAGTSGDTSSGTAAPQEKTESSEGGSGSHVKKGNGFADVAGMEDIKTLMRTKIIDVLKEPELAEKYKIHIPNGMLLYGPPGCGKSFIAEKFAEEAGWNYKFVKSSDLASTYIHGSQEKIGALFDEARKKAPMILNFDEFDALVPDRSRADSSHKASEVNEFLSQMNNCGKDRVFVIASSNRPDLIDPAVRRKGRLDQLIYLPVPDQAAREGIFRVQMNGRPQEDGIDFSRLASLTENYVAADIAYIVNDAAEKAFEKRTIITQKMLEEVIGRTAPSVGPDDISYYEGIRERLDTTAKRAESRPIGFIQK